MVDTHTIKRGETLTSIARKYNTTVNRLAELNNIKNVNLIISGATLQLPVDSFEYRTPEVQKSNTQTAEIQQNKIKQNATVAQFHSTTNELVSANKPASSNPFGIINTEAKTVPVVNENVFEQDTVELNSRRFKHRTRLLEVAQDSLGLYEITTAEYAIMKQKNPEELKNTQAVIVGDYGMKHGHQWCAYTVGYLAQEAGLDIEKFSTVQAYINKYKKDYNQISSHTMTKENYKEERCARAKEIEKQLPNMNEGDFIIWKGDYIVPQTNGKVQKSTASHIGIIEHVDLEKGIVTVIEGNANISEMNEHQERIPVRTSADCKRGAQTFGEYKDTNNRDGLIRKQYTIEELSKHGYTGFIDNQCRVK